MSAPVAADARTERSDTRWLSVALIIGVGVLGAFQVGKASIALTSVRHDLDMGLVPGSWLLSMFGLVGATLGLAVGALGGSVGFRTTCIAGVLLAAAASGAGALAWDPAMLLAARFFEAIGALCVLVVGPSLLMVVIAQRDRWLAFAAWGAHMPLGQAIMILGAPLLLAASGWRALWALNAALLVAGALLLARTVRAPARPGRATTVPEVARSMRAAWALPGPRLLAMTFVTYGFQWIAVIGFLPTLYLSRGISLGRAGVLTAAVSAVNVLGNLAAGALARRGTPAWAVIAGASAVMGASAVGIFSDDLPFWATYVLALTFSMIGGLLPGTVLVTLPRLVPAPDRLPAVNGIVMQGGQLGSAVGPLVIAGLVSATGGWTVCGWTLAALGAAGAVLGHRFARATAP